jgi:glycosyltransferase involved in cell wall biosynthesis
MSEKPLQANVSVIITTFNDADFLDGAIQSVAQQILKPLEVIIVDDGSDDPNISLRVDNLKFSFDVLFFRKVNGGASDARNYGLSKARGEYVAFLDVDDLWSCDNLAKKVSILKNKPASYFGCYGGYVCKPFGHHSTFTSFDGLLEPDLIGKKLGYPGGAPLYLFRRSALERIGGFDVTLNQNEDFDLILRLIQKNYLAVGDNEASYLRNLRAGSLTRNKNYKRSYDNVENFLNKADLYGYFSKRELSNRRALNALSCWKSCFLSFRDWKGQKQLLDTVFEDQGFRKKKYLPLFLYGKILGLIF